MLIVSGDDEIAGCIPSISMCPYVSNASCVKMPKVSGSLSSDDSSEVSDSKNCKLCRKKLHNSHFFNPKSGSLFSVCDICRKKKRDKYWRNKELLQQSTIDTRQSTRTRQYRQREPLPPKSNESATTSPTCTDLFSSIPVQSSIGKSPDVCSISNGCPKETNGKLILVPPHVSSFIWTYRQNPAYIRSYLGDYYWSLLCEPNDVRSVYSWEFNTFPLMLSFNVLLLYFVIAIMLFVSHSLMEKDFSPSTLRSIQQEFLEYNRTLTSDVGNILDTEFHIPEKIRRAVIEMIEYNVMGGKMIRGLFAVYMAYASSPVWDNRRKREAYVIGWCAELLQGAFLIADDIMDESETRRGKPSWYRVKRVGMTSINDSFILQTLIFRLIQKEIPDPKRQLSLFTVFEKIKFRTEVGQMLDLNTVNQEDRSLNYQYFSLEYYDEIITNKTAYYTIFMPVYLGLVLSECDSVLLQSPVLAELCLQLGRFFQIRDDYLDVFADPSVLKKEGTDIQEGKCSWVVLTVFSLCSEADRDVLKQNYGKNSKECVDRVKTVFNAYDVHSAYHACETETRNKVSELLNAIPDSRIVPVLQLLSDKLLKE